MKKIFFDLDGTLARFNIKNALIRFDKETDFFEKLLPYKNINIVNELSKNNNFYVISASPHKEADISKLKWLQKYLPNIKNENIIFCRLGENKAEIIKNKLKIKIDSNCILIDDYTKNLREWEQVGGIGIKRLTTVSDNSRKLWKSKTIKDLKDLQKII